MSESKNRHDAERWLLTAEEDLEAAQSLNQTGHFAQACFYSQQAGEKALKSVWFLADSDPWGHSIQRLVAEFPGKNKLGDMEKWIDSAALLDKLYIPTRYPNGLPDLTPGKVYRQGDAKEAIAAAEFLIVGCRKRFKDNK